MSTSLATIDTLNSLLEADLNSIFRFMGEGSPYLAGASPSIRDLLSAIHHAAIRQAHELASLIRDLGGAPASFQRARAEEQYLAYLSIKFLLPKLINAKLLCIERLENALSMLGDNPPAGVAQLLRKHLDEDRAFIGKLESEAATLLPAKS